jgi:hypothetical protein
MALMILFSALCAWGALSLTWVLLGWLLCGDFTALIFCPSRMRHPDGAIARYVWLRGLGVLREPLLIVGDIEESEQTILKKIYPDVEFLRPDTLADRLELERTI